MCVQIPACTGPQPYCQKSSPQLFKVYDEDMATIDQNKIGCKLISLRNEETTINI